MGDLVPAKGLLTSYPKYYLKKTEKYIFLILAIILFIIKNKNITETE